MIILRRAQPQPQPEHQPLQSAYHDERDIKPVITYYDSQPETTKQDPLLDSTYLQQIDETTDDGKLLGNIDELCVFPFNVEVASELTVLRFRQKDLGIKK